MLSVCLFLVWMEHLHLRKASVKWEPLNVFQEIRENMQFSIISEHKLSGENLQWPHLGKWNVLILYTEYANEGWWKDIQRYEELLSNLKALE